MGVAPHWDYEPTNALEVDNSGVYTSGKTLKLSTINETNLKCHVFDGS